MRLDVRRDANFLAALTYALPARITRAIRYLLVRVRGIMSII